MDLCTSKSFVYFAKCKTLSEAVSCPRGPRVEIDGKRIVGMFRRGKIVVTPEYTEQKLVSLQPDDEGMLWSFSCPVAFAELMPADGSQDVQGSFEVNDAGYLVYAGPVDGGASASSFVTAMITDNPDWFLQCFRRDQEKYLTFARAQQY